MAEVAVIIPHFNDAARLRRCLAALMLQDQTGVEVVVVDNGSAVSLDPLARDYPALRFVHEPRKGAALARNWGWQKPPPRACSFWIAIVCRRRIGWPVPNGWQGRPIW